MDKLGLLLISILPSIIIASIIYKVDKKEKEPLKQLFKAFIYGILSIIITLLISFIIGIVDINIEETDMLGIFLYSFIAIALVEEFSKWLCSYLFLRKNKDYNYMFDGIVYSVYIALGFATVENILYTIDSGIVTGIIRAVSTVPAHAFFGVTCGYYYSLHKVSKSNDKSKSNKYLLLSLFVPVILHGFYDFCLFSGNYLLLIAYLIFVVALYSFSIKNIKYMEKNDRPLEEIHVTIDENNDYSIENKDV